VEAVASKVCEKGEREREREGAREGVREKAKSARERRWGEREIDWRARLEDS